MMVSGQLLSVVWTKLTREVTRESSDSAGIMPLTDMLAPQPIEADINWNLTFGEDQTFDFFADGELPTFEQTPPEDVPAVISPPTQPPERLSIDQRPHYSTSFIGFSNESDPFSLEHFPYTKDDEVDFYRVTYRRQTGDTPLHFLQSRTETAVEGQNVISGCMSSLDEREYLEELVDKETGIALVKL